MEKIALSNLHEIPLDRSYCELELYSSACVHLQILSILKLILILLLTFEVNNSVLSQQNLPFCVMHSILWSIIIFLPYLISEAEYLLF